MRNLIKLIAICVVLLCSAYGAYSAEDGKLHKAAEYETKPEVIRQLISDGENLHEPGLEGLTPIMLAAAYNANSEIIEILIKSGCVSDCVVIAARRICQDAGHGRPYCLMVRSITQ